MTAIDPGTLAADSLFREAARRERPGLDRAFNPWERLAEPPALAGSLPRFDRTSRHDEVVIESR